MTPRRRRRREYAEWLPELDLHVDGRWDRATDDVQPVLPGQVPVIPRVVDFVAAEHELGVSA